MNGLVGHGRAGDPVEPERLAAERAAGCAGCCRPRRRRCRRAASRCGRSAAGSRRAGPLVAWMPASRTSVRRARVWPCVEPPGDRPGRRGRRRPCSRPGRCRTGRCCAKPGSIASDIRPVSPETQTEDLGKRDPAHVAVLDPQQARGVALGDQERARRRWAGRPTGCASPPRLAGDPQRRDGRRPLRRRSAGDAGGVGAASAGAAVGARTPAVRARQGDSHESPHGAPPYVVDRASAGGLRTCARAPGRCRPSRRRRSRGPPRGVRRAGRRTA